MVHIAVPVRYKEAFRNQMVKPEFENNVLELIAKSFNQDPRYMNAPTSTLGAIKFGCPVFLRDVTNDDKLIEGRNLKADDPVSNHDGAVVIKFLYIDQASSNKLPDGSLLREKAVMELLEPMVFKVNANRNGLSVRYEHKHMVVVPGIPGDENSKATEVEQLIEFEGTVQDDKIIVTFNKKPYGINLLGYFAKVHRTVK